MKLTSLVNLGGRPLYIKKLDSPFWLTSLVNLRGRPLYIKKLDHPFWLTSSRQIGGASLRVIASLGMIVSSAGFSSNTASKFSLEVRFLPFI